MSDDIKLPTHIIELEADEGDQELILLRGQQGVQGEVGPVGPVGPQGIQGEQGPQGERGIQGVQGIQGVPGRNGSDGKDGADGANGKDGVDGKTGPRGPKGDKGDKGDPGENASEEMVVEKISEVLAKVQMPMGGARGGGGVVVPMRGATSLAGGEMGLVPVPSAGDQDKVLHGDGTWRADQAGTGDVVGPASATDNAIARFDSTTGKLIQNSSVTISDVGDVEIPAGKSIKSASGNATFGTKDNGSGSAGTVLIDGGTGTTQGGDVEVTGGDASTAGPGGHVWMNAGVSKGDDGAEIQLMAGDGEGTNKNGGDVLLLPGQKTGSGTKGVVKIRDGGNTYYAKLDPGAIASSDKTFAFPNQSGTFALTSDILSGSFIGRTVKTSGTTFTTGPSTTQIIVRAWAGGGGGGGSASGLYVAGGGGGAAGGMVMKTYSVSPSTGYTCAIGAGGAGGTAGANSGSAGGDTTFTDGSTLITAKGGLGGSGSAAYTGTGGGLFRNGGAGVVGTGGDVNGAGQPGEAGIVSANAYDATRSGSGGSSAVGSGGVGIVGDNTSYVGNPGIGYAAGGGGAYSSNTGSDRAGGAGAPGLIIIDEYS